MTATPRWAPGEVVTRREVLGLAPDGVAPGPAFGGCWLEMPVHVVEDSADRLVTYVARGARFTCPDGPWPTPDGRHPWSWRHRWQGHGCLMVQRPGEHHAVWHFWDGPDRSFRYWYLNLQTAFIRDACGFDTMDLELDLIVRPDGSHEVKDAELLDDRVAEGRFTAGLVEWIRGYGADLVGRLASDGPWWDRSWADWTPPSGWDRPVR